MHRRRALNRVFQKGLDCSVHTGYLGVLEHLTPSSHGVEARSLPGRSQILWARGKKGCSSLGVAGSCLLETVSAHQHFEGQVPA